MVRPSARRKLRLLSSEPTASASGGLGKPAGSRGRPRLSVAARSAGSAADALEGVGRGAGVRSAYRRLHVLLGGRGWAENHPSYREKRLSECRLRPPLLEDLGVAGQ